LVKMFVGAGGWDYFNVPGDRLRNYAKAFNTVEVNSTYYSLPPLSVVESWRRRVPENFEFTVRCNKALLHQLQSGSINQSVAVFESMKHLCSVLRAPVLHVLSSSSFKLDKERIERIDDFLSSINHSDLQLAWEIRGTSKSGRQNLVRVLDDQGIIHCVDLSKEIPAYPSNTLYSRLFGKGIHNIYQFTNSELGDIDRKVKTSQAEKAYLNFHGVRMYKDAARLSIYETTGKFPKVTSGSGVTSVLEVLKEDALFPSTTFHLIQSQGWKICEWKRGEQRHLSEILSKVEEKTFHNLSELEAELRRMKS